MTNQEILIDALKYYTVDPVGKRCKNEDACFYSPKSVGKEGVSEGCLIGRLLSPELAELIDSKESEIGINTLINEGVYTLPSFMNQHNKYFLMSCQSLHDFDRYWTPTGLSEEGKNQVLSIIKEYNLDKSQFEKFLN